VRLVAALAIDEWVGTTLAAVGFQKAKEVVVLSRRRGAPSAGTTANQILRRRFSGRLSYFIRPVSPPDLPAIGAIDKTAFAPPWEISAQALRLALEQAARATVVEADQPSRLAGFQITTPGSHGGHLARLAVLPEFRGRGLATALVTDVAAYFDGRRADSLTVNTQDDNFASLAVYERLGFKPTGERYGVWQMRLG
jgi:ribosomal protein S18 acetylase RimI-like enzyme